MDTGSRKPRQKISPIVRAIQRVEKITSSEIRVHLSHRWREKDPWDNAVNVFEQFGMSRTTHRNAVLLYVNLKERKYAIVADRGIYEKVGQLYWNDLGKLLAEDLCSTHHENAIAMAIATIGATLHKFFPKESDSHQR